MDTLNVSFVDGTSTQVNQSFLYKFRKDPPPGNPTVCIEFDGFKRVPFLKIKEWMDYYNVGYKH